MRAVLWVPGRFSLTNKMLSNLRAAGSYRGRKPRGWVDLFAQETAAIRLAVRKAVREPGRLRGFPGQYCTLEFGVCGHRRHDPDAWYLLGKPALDGLVDALVFSSDRHEIWATSGRVARSESDEGGMRMRCAGLGDPIPVGGVGVCICLTWVHLDSAGNVLVDGCGHA